MAADLDQGVKKKEMAFSCSRKGAREKVSVIVPTEGGEKIQPF